MCGYCSEEIGLYQFILKTTLSENPMISTFYLQETNDLLGEIDNILKTTDDRMSEKDLLGEMDPHIIICRLLETLGTEGFDSGGYNHYIKNEFVEKSLIYGCLKESNSVQKINYSSSDIKGLDDFIETVSEDNFKKASEIFPNIFYYQPLYQSQTYLNREKWLEFITQGDLLQQSNEILNSYVSWWLTEKTMETSEDVDISPDRMIFDLAFRSIFFSLIWVSKSQRQLDCFKKIILRLPIELPEFDGLDLWLQRKAFGKLYKATGLKFLINSSPNIRANLPLYLLSKNNIETKDRSSLFDNLKLFQYFNQSKYIADALVTGE